jgi:hypothetical protein
MSITGKAAYDILAAAAVPFLNQSYNRKGESWTLAFCESVTGPFETIVEINDLLHVMEVVPEGKDALVVRYSVAASGNKPGIDPVKDVRVLTGIVLPDSPTTADLREVVRQFLEDAR